MYRHSSILFRGGRRLIQRNEPSMARIDDTRRSRRQSRWASAAVATVAAAGLNPVADASPAKGVPVPVVTRAALDPALVAGRGAGVDFAEQEAENAATSGTVIGPG